MATPTEVSEQLDIPPATLRRYVSLFGDHLSEEAKLPRGRQFGDEDLEVLARIRTMLSDGSSVEDVQTALRGGAPSETEQTRPAGSEAPEGATALTVEAEPETIRPVPVVQSELLSEAAPPESGAGTEIAEAADGEAPEVEKGAGDDEPGDRPHWRSYARVQPVRSSREVRKMVAETGSVDLLSQRLALAEDRIMTSNERMAVLEARIVRLEEWLTMPWYRRLFAKPPEYDL